MTVALRGVAASCPPVWLEPLQPPHSAEQWGWVLVPQPRPWFRLPVSLRPRCLSFPALCSCCHTVWHVSSLFISTFACEHSM